MAALSIALWLARRTARGRLDSYDPAGHVPAAKLWGVISGQGSEEFERLTVEQFLIHAFNSPHPFEGEEWADRKPPCGKCGEPMVRTVYPSGAASWTCPECAREHRAKPTSNDSLLPAWLEPPLVRVRCIECGSEKDAWVADDGTLEDERDQWCKHPDDSVHPTALAEEE